MSNTRQAANSKATDNGEPDEKAAAQAAQQAEAEGSAQKVEFHGHVYEVLPDQPSPKAMTHLAQFALEGQGLAIIPAIIEAIGRDQWDQWCERHKTNQMVEFWHAIEDVTGGNS